MYVLLMNMYAHIGHCIHLAENSSWQVGETAEEVSALVLNVACSFHYCQLWAPPTWSTHTSYCVAVGYLINENPIWQEKHMDFAAVSSVLG